MGIKSKLMFNDYLLFFEKNEDVQKRIFESTGLLPKGGKLESYESLDKTDLEGRIIKNASKDLLKVND